MGRIRMNDLDYKCLAELHAMLDESPTEIQKKRRMRYTKIRSEVRSSEQACVRKTIVICFQLL